MKNKSLCFGQVMILLVGIFAFSFAIGSEVGFVSAGDLSTCTVGNTCQVTLTDGRTKTGILTETNNPSYPYGLTDSDGNFIEFSPGDTQSQYFGDSMVESSSLGGTASGAGASTTAGDSVGTLRRPGAVTNDNYPDYGERTADRGAGTDAGNSASSSGENPDHGERTAGSGGADADAGNSASSSKASGDYGKKEGNIAKRKADTTQNIEGFTDLKGYSAETKNVEGIHSSSGIGGGLVEGIKWATITKFAVSWISKQALGQSEEQAEVIGSAAGAGVLSYYLTKGAFEQWGSSASTGLGSTSFWVGTAIALWYLWENYEEVDSKSVVFECTVWEPERGGEDCEECNNEILGCSEYQCKSLGKGCELLNPGTEEELCTWINRNDVESPVISPWRDALEKNTAEYDYSPDDRISPPDRGVTIHPADDEEGCIDAYTPLKFGVTLDEPATCKIAMERTDSYEDMDFYFGSSSLARYNHSHTMSLPSLNATGTILKSGEDLELYVRCEDANGNSNLADFVFTFCVGDEDDFTPPLITDTSITNNQPVAYNLSELEMSIYVNEDAECKWSRIDDTYERMENNMTCDLTPNSIIRNTQVVYPCNATLTGIKDRESNDFYFRCNDTSGNVNKESHELTLIGTQPLYIDWAKPEGTIKDSVSPVQLSLEAKTSSGYSDGNAFCFYKPTDSTVEYIQFKYEPADMTYQHKQDLTFSSGDYDYTIRCIDAGGNVALQNISFSVETDLSEPVVSRAYREEGYLKLITNEAGECVYNTNSELQYNGCGYEFDDGIAMQTVDEDEHFVEWNSEETFYIKCKDSFGNPPAFNSCSIVARPSEGDTL